VLLSRADLRGAAFGPPFFFAPSGSLGGSGRTPQTSRPSDASHSACCGQISAPKVCEAPGHCPGLCYLSRVDDDQVFAVPLGLSRRCQIGGCGRPCKRMKDQYSRRLPVSRRLASGLSRQLTCVLLTGRSSYRSIRLSQEKGPGEVRRGSGATMPNNSEALRIGVKRRRGRCPLS